MDILANLVDKDEKLGTSDCEILENSNMDLYEVRLWKALESSCMRCNADTKSWLWFCFMDVGTIKKLINVLGMWEMKNRILVPNSFYTKKVI